MGMYDQYEPDPSIHCPYCGTALTEWQGKDGPCVLLIWRQGIAAPRGPFIDPKAALDRFRLPQEFHFAPAKVGCRFCPSYAIGHSEDGVWKSTTLVLLSDAPFHEQVDFESGPHQWIRA